MRKVLSGLAVVALACATGTAAFAQANGDPAARSGGTNTPATTSPTSEQTMPQYPTSAEGTQGTGGMNGNPSARSGGTNGSDVNASGSMNGSVNGAGTTGVKGTMNESIHRSMNVPTGVDGGTTGPNMVDVHDPTWQYELMARQYHWNAPPHRTNSSTTTNGGQ